MAVTPLKAFLFAGSGIVAAGGVAYVSGALDPYLGTQPPAEIAALPSPAAAPGAPAEVSPGTGVHEVTPAPAASEPDKPAEAAVPPAESSDTARAEPAAPAMEAMKPSRPDAPKADASKGDAPKADAMKPAAPSAEAPAPVDPAAQPATPPAVAGPAAPTFDVVRVEGDGSLVVAGNAPPNARVEILDGTVALGSTTAGPDGAFAIVLDDPLKPGDYQLTLRATVPDGAAAMSQQTAVVSVPEKPDGQVLAMVEEPGKPAELMAVPEPAELPAAASRPVAKPPESAPAEAAATPEPADPGATPPAEEAAQAAVEAKPAPAGKQSPAVPAVAPKVAVEAVEIDGDKVFVAGIADPGRKVRAYANEILLGDGMTSPDGHFLVEATRDLPVGTYTVRVDALDTGGAKVVARATVPFEREPGESIAAVAPAEPASPAAEQSAETASAEPAENAGKPAPATPPAGATAQAPAGAKAQSSQAQPAPAGSADAHIATPPVAAAASEQPAAPAASAPEKLAEVAPAAPPSDGVPETVSPKLEHSDGAVIIRRHDTLWHISRRVYGHGIRYSTIYLANQDQIADPDLIWPGQVFRVPEKSKEGETANLKALGDQATTAPVKTD